MAYNGQNQKSGGGNSGGNNFHRPAAAAKPAQQQAPEQSATGLEKTSFFKAFKNKGLGYGVKLKEDILIPAGTQVAIFEDVLKGKDGTEYQVLNVKKMKDRE